jgi:putative ABC transport system permease protein
MTRRSLIRLRRLGRQAVRAQLRHKRRTAFGASALTLGVASVVVMAAVSAGAERRVLERVRAMGSNLLVIRPAVAPIVAGRARQSAAVTTLRPGDANLIAVGSPLAAAAAPAVMRQVVARWDGRNAPTMLSGTSTTGLRIQGVSAMQGRLFDEHEELEQRRVAIVGATLARNLFGATDPVGQTMLVERVPFEVIGVMRRRGTDVGGTDLDNTVSVPLSTAMRRVLNVPFVDALFVQARRISDLDALARDAVAILQSRQGARSGIQSEFELRNQAVLLRTERGTSRAFRALMVATAGLALLLGAVTILAVMMLSVRERVPEIALRRAVGARVRDIQSQFVIESALLASLGGALGVLTGLAAAVLGAAAGRWDMALPWQAVLGGLAAPLLTGVLVGVVPAVRAARLDPGVGLRLRA